MKEINVTIGQWYVVEGAAGDTITNPSTDRAIATVEDGKQASFYATSAVVVASSDSVQVHRANFNSAPVKLRLLGLLGGGTTTTLPAGYIAAEFLESTGTQYILTSYVPTIDFGARVIFSQEEPETQTRAVGGVFSPYFVLPRYYSGSRIVGGWGFNEAIYINNRPYISGKHTSSLNYKNSRLLEFDTVDKHDLMANWVDGVGALSLFAYNNNNASSNSINFIGGIRIYDAIFTMQYSEIGHYIPAIDTQGAPCMYDKMSKQSFYNSGSGSFVVGLTLAQARKLDKLPATGGTLTISLPSNWQDDEGVVNALATAESNGWVLTYQTYEADASAASTFALRRIFARKTQDENGQYIDADGTRWHVEWCAGMIGAEPTDHGYEPFRSIDSAVAYWELTPWVDPEAQKMMQDELLTNSTTNEHE